MASAHSAAWQGPLPAGTVPYRRFSELIFVSVAGHYGFALLYGLWLGQGAIAMALAGPATLVLALSRWSRAPWPSAGSGLPATWASCSTSVA